MPVIEGAAALLGQRRRLDIPTMMADPNLPELSAQYRRQFFTEIMRTSLEYAATSDQDIATGSRTAASRCVLVNQQIAWALFTLLLISFLLLLALLRSVRPGVRPVQMCEDPSILLSMYWWAARCDRTLSSLRALDLSTKEGLKSNMGDLSFRTMRRGLEQPKSCCRE